MAKADAADPAPLQIQDPAPTTFPLTVEEFCAQLSKDVRLPELIYAFSKDELREGRYRDTSENYQARFAAFGNRIPA